MKKLILLLGGALESPLRKIELFLRTADPLVIAAVLFATIMAVVIAIFIVDSIIPAIPLLVTMVASFSLLGLLSD